MGNRAVIATNNKDLGVYLHWNGSRDDVESFLAYCDMKGYRPPEKDEYGWARLCQVIGNTIGGTLSLGIGKYERQDLNNGDNGVYIIKDWDIVEREVYNYPEEHEKFILSSLEYINLHMPENDQVTAEEMIKYANYWNEKHKEYFKGEAKPLYGETELEELINNGALSEKDLSEMIQILEIKNTKENDIKDIDIR